jgi:DNA-binding NtrC family response regulator
MIGVDGVALFQKATDQYPTIPFVFITGHAESERLVSVPSGSPILTKPFTTEALMACIWRVLADRTNNQD